MVHWLVMSMSCSFAWEVETLAEKKNVNAANVETNQPKRKSLKSLPSSQTDIHTLIHTVADFFNTCTCVRAYVCIDEMNSVRLLIGLSISLPLLSLCVSLTPPLYSLPCQVLLVPFATTIETVHSFASCNWISAALCCGQTSVALQWNKLLWGKVNTDNNRGR